MAGVEQVGSGTVDDQQELAVSRVPLTHNAAVVCTDVGEIPFNPTGLAPDGDPVAPSVGNRRNVQDSYRLDYRVADEIEIGDFHLYVVLAVIRKARIQDRVDACMLEALSGECPSPERTWTDFVDGRVGEIDTLLFVRHGWGPCEICDGALEYHVRMRDRVGKSVVVRDSQCYFVDAGQRVIVDRMLFGAGGAVSKVPVPRNDVAVGVGRPVIERNDVATAAGGINPEHLDLRILCRTVVGNDIKPDIFGRDSREREPVISRVPVDRPGEHRSEIFGRKTGRRYTYFEFSDTAGAAISSHQHGVNEMRATFLGWQKRYCEPLIGGQAAACHPALRSAEVDGGFGRGQRGPDAGYVDHVRSDPVKSRRIDPPGRKNPEDTNAGLYPVAVIIQDEQLDEPCLDRPTWDHEIFSAASLIGGTGQNRGECGIVVGGGRDPDLKVTQGFSA